MKAYWYAIATACWTVTWVGFILPGMISAENSLVAILGCLFGLCLFLPGCYFLGRAAFREINWEQLRRLVPLILLAVLIGACSRVPVGDVGVKVKSLGSDKGVEAEVLGVGYYWIGWNEQLFLFPVAMQQYVWTESPHEGSAVDESMSFQDLKGVNINADFGIAYQFDLKKITTLFQQYRQGPNEIRSITIRNEVRDTLIKLASNYTVEDLLGPKKTEFLNAVNQTVREDLVSRGIIIDHIYSVNKFRVDQKIQDSINQIIQANQNAERTEAELRSSKAQAQKMIAIAEGEAQANDIVTKSLNPMLLQAKTIEKWNGVLSQVTGSGTPLIDLKGGHLGKEE